MTTVTTYPVSLENDLSVLPGCAFGIDEPTCLGSFVLNLPFDLDVATLTAWLKDAFTIDLEFDPPAYGELHSNVAQLLLDCHLSLLRQAKIPVFSSSVIIQNSDSDKGPLHRSVSFATPSAGKFTTRTALELVAAITNQLLQNYLNSDDTSPSKISSEIARTLEVLRRFSLHGVNSMNFLKAARLAGMPATCLLDGQNPLIIVGMGNTRRMLSSSYTDKTSVIGSKVAQNKFVTGKMLRHFGLPTPRHYLVGNEQSACVAATKLGYPVVVKPADREQGKGVFANIVNEHQLKSCYAKSCEFSSNILLEKHYPGEDYRLTVLHGKLIKVMHRRPGGVIGDGKHSVNQLYEQYQNSPENQEIVRREGKTRLLWDDEAEECLQAQGLTAQSIPADNHFVALRRKNNISSGGSYQVVPLETVHRDNAALAVRTATVLNLDLAGIDLLAKDIGIPWHDCGAVICEVNSQPQIGIRHTPSIYRQILQELVPDNGIIPVHLRILTDEFEAQWNDVDDYNRMAVELAGKLRCDGLSTRYGGWINGKCCVRNPVSSFAAACNLMHDPKVNSLLCIMRVRDVLRFGLPACYFRDIGVMTAGDGRVDKKESRTRRLSFLRSLVEPHTESFQWLTEGKVT